MHLPADHELQAEHDAHVGEDGAQADGELQHEVAG
jgi:hypothetical protein